jgi:hypothetical protein
MNDQPVSDALADFFLRQRLFDSRRRIKELESKLAALTADFEQAKENAETNARLLNESHGKLAAMTTPREGDAVMDAIAKAEDYEYSNRGDCEGHNPEIEYIRQVYQAKYTKWEAEIAALRTQIPRIVKPLDIEVYESGHGWWRRAWSCPICGTETSRFGKHQGVIPDGDKYCSCGVKFDWYYKAES